ncbi:30S ribosomal protein S20 [bacterium HR19]|nr:30S ribosomal protein S20 [bacterium HR19]
MPVTKSAKRKLKKSLKRRERNLFHLTKMKNAIRLFKKKLDEQNEITEQVKNQLEEELKKVISIISHVASKGVIHRNEASRRISRITKFFNKVLSQKLQKQESRA